MEYKQYYRSILRLGLPIMVGQLGIIVVGFVDTMMVGHYSTDSLAASSFVNTIFNLITMVCMGFSYGLTPLVATLYGQGKRKEAGVMFKDGVMVNLLFGVMLTVVSTILYFCIEHMGQPEHLLPLIKSYYLTMLASLIFVSLFNSFRQFSDGIGQVSVTMFVLLGSNVFNIIFNYLLIFGNFGFPELGLLGAGLSTLGSRIFAAAAGFVMFRYAKRYAEYRKAWNDIRPSRVNSMKILTTSWPVAMQMGLETGFFTFSGVMMGWIGAIALASYQIMGIVGMLGFIIYYSFAASMSIKISQLHGQQDTKGVLIVSKCGFWIITVMMVTASAIFYFFGYDLISIFTEDEQVKTAALALILPLILYQFGDASQIVYSNALRGIAHVVPMTWVALVSYIIIGAPTAYIFAFPLGGGAVGIFFAFSVGLFLAAFLYRKLFLDKLSEINRTLKKN